MFDAAAQSLPGVEAAAWISSAPFLVGLCASAWPAVRAAGGGPKFRASRGMTRFTRSSTSLPTSLTQTPNPNPNPNL
jgi:hypothetical protein